MANNFCVGCGKPLEPSANYCIFCARPVSLTSTAQQRVGATKSTAESFPRKISFGNYMQMCSVLKEPIEWRVLAVENGRAFLLAEKILDAQPYNIKRKAVTWGTCTLRTWLNYNFYNEAFNATEKAKILTTTTEVGTGDMVFLLSNTEATSPVYGFGSSSMWNDIWKKDLSRRANSTDFAKSRGLLSSFRVEKDSDEGDDIWWLRTLGRKRGCACAVTVHGYISDNYYSVTSERIGVRPALWINL